MFRKALAAIFDEPGPQQTLPGREAELPGISQRHAVLDAPLKAPFGEGVRSAVFGLGCFWGAEKIFWQLPGVVSTAVGYAGGMTPNPTYKEVCSGRTGHTEAVLVAYDPAQISYEQLLKAFWEGHNPTHGMRQGNDVGPQYRSAIYWDGEDQQAAALASAESYGEALKAAGKDAITTEIAAAGPFYYAEDSHQQYLHKVPRGYCGLGSTGVSCPVAVLPAA